MCIRVGMGKFPDVHEEDMPMLINCVAYQDGRKLADIPLEDISESRT